MHTRTRTHIHARSHMHTHTQMQQLSFDVSSGIDHQRELYRSERLGVWTKLRPGVRDFLSQAAEKFELWVRSSSSRYVCVCVCVRDFLAQAAEKFELWVRSSSSRCVCASIYVQVCVCVRAYECVSPLHNFTHIRTHRPYADAMVSLLDPEERFFSGRVIATH